MNFKINKQICHKKTNFKIKIKILIITNLKINMMIETKMIIQDL